jgi:hypothetical protein
MIEWGPTHYVLGIWMVGYDRLEDTGQPADWMTTVYKDREDTQFTVAWRMRYHATSQRGLDAPPDQKNWYMHLAPPTHTAADIIKDMDTLVAARVREQGGCPSRIIVRGDAGKAVRLLSKHPWAQTYPAAALHDN